jgi:hypothetical protein
MKKINLLSRAEMRKISGGTTCPPGQCWNYSADMCDRPENVGEICDNEVICTTYCRDANNNVLNPNQELVVPSCSVALDHCKLAYPTSVLTGCACTGA